jgi:hypothetical protein
MRDHNREISEIRTGTMIEIISTIVFLGGWGAALIILATPL